MDKGAFEGNLDEEGIDIVFPATAFGQNDGLAGAGCRRTHAIDLLSIRVGAADDAQEQGVARGAAGDGQVGLVGRAR